MLVPTARGDLIAGIAQGFAALRAGGLWRHDGPRLIAVEPFPRLCAVLAGKAEVTDGFPVRGTRQSSIAGSTATDQSLRAVRDTGGCAIAVDDRAAAEAQSALARQGIACRALRRAPFAALHPLFQLRPCCGRGDKIVLIATAAADRETGAASVCALNERVQRHDRPRLPS